MGERLEYKGEGFEKYFGKERDRERERERAIVMKLRRELLWEGKRVGEKERERVGSWELQIKKQNIWPRKFLGGNRVWKV